MDWVFTCLVDSRLIFIFQMIICLIPAQYLKGLCYYKAGNMRWILFGPWLQMRLYDALAF